ncbi:MAG: FprA family A-type flavoprotein [Bacteroidales bacterium]|nr:FprA family A-type flavoprotein [Bacteroidales bacterium]
MNKTDNRVLEIIPDVHRIGVLDYDIVTFDVVMETRYGTTYNSYFINAEKKAIIETSKEKFWEVYEAKIRQVTDPAEISYIILDHTEPDHSGNVRNLLNLAPNATVIGSQNAIRYLTDMIGDGFNHRVVKDGDTLDLGNKRLCFISAPNLHWPDSIYTYLEEDKLLFTCDSFGAHFAHPAMFDDLVGDWSDAFDYYFDVILKPYSKFMLKAIEKIRPLEIAAICTGHGPILRSQWQKIVDKSERLAKTYLAKPEKKFVYIPYVSAYNKTGMIAQKIAEGIRQIDGLEVEVQDIEMTPIGELEEKLTRCNALIVGSPVINQNILLPVYRLFALINPLRDKGKLAGSFGSYGWSGENSKMIESNLRLLKLDYFDAGVFVKFTPMNDEIQRCISYGRSFGEQLLEKNK